MGNSIIFYKTENKPLEVVISCIPDWEGFDKLIKFIQQYYAVEIIAQYDGPGARKWILEHQGHRFELIHDDGYGNYFLCPSIDSERLVCEIGRDLEARFKN